MVRILGCANERHELRLRAAHVGRNRSWRPRWSLVETGDMIEPHIPRGGCSSLGTARSSSGAQAWKAPPPRYTRRIRAIFESTAPERRTKAAISRSSESRDRGGGADIY